MQFRVCDLPERIEIASIQGRRLETIAYMLISNQSLDFGRRLKSQFIAEKTDPWTGLFLRQTHGKFI